MSSVVVFWPLFKYFVLAFAQEELVRKMYLDLLWTSIVCSNKGPTWLYQLLLLESYVRLIVREERFKSNSVLRAWCLTISRLSLLFEFTFSHIWMGF
ncbi:unnamed protein product [Brassica oleracea var. botrytis]|uniref:BnaC03g75460D protein n=2 Tax=Brassica napus TaxID=3708 RepID=A0A078J070_BRANA|nr:hypothetical protein HID58_055827 [Brassica napus]CAF1708934.1 unnamed protein product [Brassica napus]CDY55023.1 BnaC03g75460D [Brassica napus]